MRRHKSDGTIGPDRRLSLQLVYLKKNVLLESTIQEFSLA